MKTLVFQGYLNALYPDGIKVDADSAYEAVGLLSNYPGFRPEDGVIHKVHLPKFPSVDSAKAKTSEEIIEIVPMDMVENSESFRGAGNGKSGAWIQIIVGAVLMYFSYGSYGSEMFAAGLAMALGGLLQLLMPAPKKAENSNDPKSNYLAANKNTVAIGTVIPLGFGRRKLYGHFLSFNVTATNLNAAAPDAEEGTGTGTALGSNPIFYRGAWTEHDSGGEAPDDGDAPDAGTAGGDNGTGD